MNNKLKRLAIEMDTYRGGIIIGLLFLSLCSIIFSKGVIKWYIPIMMALVFSIITFGFEWIDRRFTTH